jgi:hypothetical protein
MQGLQFLRGAVDAECLHRGFVLTPAGGHDDFFNTSQFGVHRLKLFRRKNECELDRIPNKVRKAIESHQSAAILEDMSDFRDQVPHQPKQ